LTNKYVGDYSDPLAMAERGKIGVPCGTSSECSSSSSVDASVESNTGLMSGEKKGIRSKVDILENQLSPDGMCFSDRRSIIMHNVKVQQTSPIKETRIEKVGDSKQSSVQSLSSNKYSKLALQQQNSLEEIPDINANSSQDVSTTFTFSLIKLS
jgi:synaptotagmin-14/16